LLSKHVAKDGELFNFYTPGIVEPAKRDRGFADVWKKECFGWEYKGPGEDLEKAYKQLLRYRESLLNPPLLIVCDFHRYIVRTNFNGAVQETHSFTNAEVDTPSALRVLRAALTKPEELRPRVTTAEVTEKLARQIAEIARSLQEREAVELDNAKTRRQHYVAQKQNLRIARFLNRLVFCFFAEDTGLLPTGIFADVCKAGVDDPQHFAESLEELFVCMAKGGRFGTHKIRHFNGHLFEDSTVFELTAKEIADLAAASAASWQNIEPSIMGNLFERGLDPNQRAQLGAHYTSEDDIRTLVEPVLMAPLRREWKELRRELAPLIMKGKAAPSARDSLGAFQAKLAGFTVLDPACGSGNFLYVALQLLLTLEKEVITAAAALGITLAPRVSVQQLRAIELNAYAFELAQVTVQIGFLQWRRDNGFDNDRTPVLQNLDGFENKDALLNETFRKKPKDLKAAQAEEHSGQDDLFKVYTERAWSACNVIVGNPPFLGDKFMRGELGNEYVEELRDIFGNRIPGQSDLCCYWFEKARQQIEDGHCQRAGLLATQGIRGGANREVLKRIKETGDIFFAESDRDWILAGANVHVSMIGFDNGAETLRALDGNAVTEIHANLAASAADTSSARLLESNANISFQGPVKVGSFEISPESAHEFLLQPNPHGRPNSDVLQRWVNGRDVTTRDREFWIINFRKMSVQDAAVFDAPFRHLEEHVKSERLQNRDNQRRTNWWRLGRSGDDWAKASAGLARTIFTPRVAKHRVFVWSTGVVLPDTQVVAFARDDDYFFGLLHSRIHEAWARAHGTQVRERESGFRYTPTSCFETFPFPEASPEQRAAIAEAAKELNALRESWLNPPEWTAPRMLTFPGALDGPWRRFVRDADARGIGTVHYPLAEPRDAECAAKLAKRTLTNLYNERPAWLVNAHAKLDAAVAVAYGWPPDLSDDEILSRLLALNLARAGTEKVGGVMATVKNRASREKTAEELL
jgi:type II restriction/modification system DNA methylase subunit YeeA